MSYLLTRPYKTTRMVEIVDEQKVARLDVVAKELEFHAYEDESREGHVVYLNKIEDYSHADYSYAYDYKNLNLLLKMSKEELKELHTALGEYIKACDG